MASNAISGSSWLIDWLNAQGAASGSDIERIFATPGSRREFRDFLDEVPLFWPTSDPGARASIAAGSGMDLSGSIGSCTSPDCLKREVDNLIQRTWHYFDRVVVAGPSSLRLASTWDHNESYGVQQVAAYAEVLWHINASGADNLFVLSQKPPAGLNHLKQHATEVGMADLLNDEDRWAQEVLPEAGCGVEWQGSNPECSDSHWDYRLDHPALEHTKWGSVHAPEDAAESEVVRLALIDTYRDHVANLVMDIKYARIAGSALGAVARVHEDILQERTRVIPSEGEVAFELPLPVLNGVSSKELLALREDNFEEFETFREALRQAITERLRSMNQDQRDATAIAVEIVEDVISPAVSKIANQMRAAERLLSRSGGLTVGVTAIATTVGLMLQAPVVIGPLLGAAVAGVDLKRYWADKKDVELSDMYFLWRLAEVHARQGH